METATAYFKRNLFLSYRGIGLLFIIVISIFFCLEAIQNVPEYLVVFILVTICTVWIFTIYQGYRVYYFGVSATALVIRNSIFFWQRREILFSEIKSARIDTDTKHYHSRFSSPYYLAVFYEGLKKEKFYAGTLNGKQWALLTQALEQQDIPVVNTSFYIPFKDLL